MSCSEHVDNVRSRRLNLSLARSLPAGNQPLAGVQLETSSSGYM